MTAETEEALHRYIRTDRSRLDTLGRRKLAQLGNDDPVFLARGGRAFSAGAFRWQWLKLRKKAEREFARTDFREPWPATQDATSPLFLRVTVEGHEYCVKAFTVDTDKAVSASKECNTQVASQQPRTAATRGVGVGCSQ